MKFLCLGYLDEKRWDALADDQRQALIARCLAYDEVLKVGGHFAGGDCLDHARHARTLRRPDETVQITDGPFAETKEMLGGILHLEARDMDEAVELMSKHPGLEMGPFEIRPAVDPQALQGEAAEACARR